MQALGGASATSEWLTRRQKDDVHAMDGIFSQKLFEEKVLCEDLEYTPVFAEFTALATPREERQIGEYIVPAQAPVWGEVFKMGCALLERSRDLRILHKVCCAALYQFGLPGLAQGLSLMAHWVESGWDDLYPRLYVDGEYDPLLRSNAIAEISDPEGLVRSLRQSIFLDTPIGSVIISVAEHLLNGKSFKGDVLVSSLDQLSRMVVAESVKNHNSFAAISSIHLSLNKITSVYKERFDPDYWPNLELITDIVVRLDGFITTRLGKKSVHPEVVSHEPSASSVSRTTDFVGSLADLPLQLNTRTEAIKALSLARAYFENNEPSHPASLMIRRVERLVGLDFLTIIKELAPGSLQHFQILTGDARE